MKIKVLWYWQTMGPYHFARMGALAALPNVDLSVVECTSLDDHAWVRSGSAVFEYLTLANEELSRDVLRKTGRSLLKTLQTIKPDVVVAPGYAQPECLGPILTYRNSAPRTLVILW